MNARASADSISAVWGLTEAQWLERVRSAEAKLDVCEAERDRAVALLRDALDALDHDDCWVTSEEARLLASVSIEETNE